MNKITSHDIQELFERFSIYPSYISVVGLDVTVTGKMNSADAGRALLAKGWYWTALTFHDDDETLTVEFALDNLVSDLTDEQFRGIHRQIQDVQARIDRGQS